MWGWIQHHKAYAAVLALIFPFAAMLVGIVGVAKWLYTNWDRIWTDIQAAVRDFIDFFKQAWADIKQWTTDGVNAVKGAFTGAASWLTQAGKDILGGLWAGIDWVWQNVIKPFFDGVKTLFVDFFTKGAGAWLLKGGKDILTGLMTGVTWVWDNVLKPYFVNIPVALAKFFATAITWLVDKGKDIITGLLNGAKAILAPIAQWLHDHVLTPIVNYFAGAVTWLFDHGKDLLTGLLRGMLNIAVGVSAWLHDHVFAPIVNYFLGAAGWLFQHGKDVVGGLLHGIFVAMAGIFKWIGDNIFTPIKNAIVSFFGLGSPSRVAADWGKNVILGFLAGMLKVNPMAVVKKVFGSVAHGAQEIFKAAGGLASGLFGSLGGASNSAGGPVAKAGAFASEQALGQMMAAQRGWTGAEWASLNALVMGESGWNPTAQNPTSTAYGIAQNIGGPAGYPDDSAGGQIDWMLNYIAQRYGDPVHAYSTWLSRSPHWYDKGGLLPPGLSLAYNGTGRAEVIAPGGAAGGVTVIVQGNVYGSGGIQELSRQVRFALERDSRAGTPGLVR